MRNGRQRKRRPHSVANSDNFRRNPLSWPTRSDDAHNSRESPLPHAPPPDMMFLMRKEPTRRGAVSPNGPRLQTPHQ